MSDLGVIYRVTTVEDFDVLSMFNVVSYWIVGIHRSFKREQYNQAPVFIGGHTDPRVSRANGLVQSTLYSLAVNTQ